MTFDTAARARDLLESHYLACDETLLADVAALATTAHAAGYEEGYAAAKEKYRLKVLPPRKPFIPPSLVEEER